VRARRWNHNLHYHHVLLDAVPTGCQRALDVGCGEGTLARQLRRSARQVSAIDVDEASITAARREDPGQTIDYQLGDFLSFPFAPGSFDFVTCVAALHHMHAEAALRRMSELLAPRGTLAVLGLARSRFPADLPRDLAARADRSSRTASTCCSEGWSSSPAVSGCISTATTWRRAEAGARVPADYEATCRRSSSGCRRTAALRSDWSAGSPASPGPATSARRRCSPAT
jgi:SAM-dependent methyltransferase